MIDDEVELNIGELRRKRGRTGNPAHSTHGGNGSWHRNGRAHEPRPRRLIEQADAEYDAEAEAPHDDRIRLPFDPWRLVEALRRRWHWLAASALILGLIGFAVAFRLIGYRVNVELMRREAPNAFATQGADAFKPRELSFETLASYMKTSELLERVASKAQPPVSPRELARGVRVEQSRNPDIIVLSLEQRGERKAAASLANLYAEEVLQFTQRMQTNETAEVKLLLQKKISATDAELRNAQDELIAFSKQEDVIVSVEKEAEAYLAELSAVDLRYETARIDLETMTTRIAALRDQLSRQSPGADKLAAAREKLDQLLLKFTELHPEVQAQQAEIAAIENRIAAGSNNKAAGTVVAGNALASTLALQIADLEAQRGGIERQTEELKSRRDKVQNKMKALSEKGVRYALIKAKIQSAQNVRDLLLNRQRDVQLFEDNSLGYFKVFSYASVGSINGTTRWMKVGAAAFAAAVAGLLAALLAVLLTEVVDTRLKTAEDVERITGLPVLATLGDLEKMEPGAQVNWAFRTLTLLKGKLGRNGDEGLVCGFISAHHEEGRSTWINLLVSAASQRGLKVLTVATRPATSHADSESEPEMRSEPQPHAESGAVTVRRELPERLPGTLTTSVLSSPGKVAEQLANEDSQPVVHIPLPGWVWNLDRRKQWQAALAQWRKIENLVLLVELPPASQPEAILLAENVPQLIWLTGSGMADAAETRGHIETLRHARCNLVGAVVNREPMSIWRTHVARWLRRATFATCAALCLLPLGAAGQNAPAPAGSPSSTNATMSAASRPKRAPWQERLTLGPGDALDFTMFGHPELTRTNLFVGLDGRISYLQAQSVQAAGLTVDELRAKFDEELGKYYRAARTIIIPVSYTSKKYYVLGKVNTKGAFPLDRPLTVVEAVARAKGLETGLFQRNSVELADLSRSFLIRNGKRMEVNLEKLFLEGDLSQNVAIEPGDYLYFPSTSLNEIYVLGEVMNPGIVGFAPASSLIAAVTDRGGFTSKAYTKKVLVIRGSLHNPETFIVNAADILGARGTDFRLEQKDIVYISKRPWVKVEELLDEAAEAFLQAMVASWTGLNVGPFIGHPFTPRL